VGGDTYTVLSTAIATNRVTLTLAGKISAGRTVNVSYTAPDASASYTNLAVQDLQGNDAPSFSSLVVTNNSTVTLDSTSPVISTAAVNTAGTLLTLTYTDADNLASITAPNSAFTVTRNGSEIAVSSIAISGKTVVLTLGRVIGSGQTVTVAYAAPDSSTSINNLAVQDLQGNDAASISPAMAVTNSSTQDKTPPALSSTAVSTGGIQITLTFNTSIHATTADTSTFAVSAGSTNLRVQSVTSTGSTVVLTMQDGVIAGETITVSYTAPLSSEDTTNNAIQDAVGNDALSFTTSSVTNNSTKASAPNCAAGYRQGGRGGTDVTAAKGGNGCVVVFY
jgi:uncharacterized repeat protein (TIGR02059 family)